MDTYVVCKVGIGISSTNLIQKNDGIATTKITQFLKNAPNSAVNGKCYFNVLMCKCANRG